MECGTTTFSITVNMMTLCIAMVTMAMISIITHKMLVMLIVTIEPYAECHYAKCRRALDLTRIYIYIYIYIYMCVCVCVCVCDVISLGTSDMNKVTKQSFHTVAFKITLLILFDSFVNKLVNSCNVL
jgi:hypothetical protein